MNLLLKIGFAVGAIFGGSKLISAINAKNVSDEMNINIINPRIQKIDKNPLTGGIEIQTEVQLQNPTKGKLQITQPFIQILANSSPIISTKVESKQYTIQALSELTLDTISIKISWTTLFKLITSTDYGFPENFNTLDKILWFISNYKQVIEKMNLSVKYTTYANGLYYTETKNIVAG